MREKQAAYQSAKHISFEWSFPVFVMVRTEFFTFSKVLLNDQLYISYTYTENAKHTFVWFLTLIRGLKFGARIL